MIASWFVRQPPLFRRECAELARDYPEMHLDNEAFAKGSLAFEGTFDVAMGGANEAVILRLEYPAGFPYLRPEVIPQRVTGLPPKKEPRFFSARHQMANGSICLFERGPADDPHAYVSGIVALRRARTWLPHAIRRLLPKELDTLEAELDGHYQRAGDILLGPMMFDGLGACGELVLGFYPMPLRPEGYPLHIATHLEDAGTWRTDEATFKKIGVPWPPQAWAVPPAKHPALRRARWYTLEQEPVPVRTALDLARLLFPGDDDPLKRLKQDAAAPLATYNALDVPIRFPGRRPGRWEWLFLHLPIRAKSLAAEVVEVGGRAHVGHLLDFSGSSLLDAAPVHVLRSHDLRRASLEIRNTGRVPNSADALSFGIAGAGALGSACVDLLAKAGVGALRLVDPALLNADNAVRHLASVTAAGMPKALVVDAVASAHNPHCDISAEPVGVLELPADSLFWKTSAVLSTIADDAMELALNRWAAASGVTVYYLRALRSGTAGRLVRVRPGIDACFECIGHYHAEGDGRAVIVPAQSDEVITRECGQPVLAASAADLAVVAGLGVRQLLVDVTAPSANNQWVWTSEGIPSHAKLQEPFSRMAAALAPHAKCAVCATTAPRSVRISSEIQQLMVSLARQDAPRETGGILVGRREGQVVRVLRASDAGPNAVREPTRFERDGRYCQAFLERAVADLGSGVDYVGEWHSHPGGSAAPSPRDTRSFEEIASDPNYLTTAPVLLIVAPSSSDDRVDWSSSVFPVDGLARSIPLEEDASA